MNQINLIKQSFKEINTKIIIIMLIDTAFYLIFGGIFLLLVNWLKAKSEGVILDSSFLESEGKATTLGNEIAGIFFSVIGILLIMILVGIILVSITKGIIWQLTWGKKIKEFNFKKFFIVNSKWVLLCSIPILFGIVLLKPSSLTTYSILVGSILLYFTNILYSKFVQDQSTSIKKALNLGTKKAGKLLPSFLIIVLLYFILTTSFRTLFAQIHSIILAIVLITFIAWSRYYFVQAMKNN